jgi:hypothetical protein
MSGEGVTFPFTFSPRINVVCYVILCHDINWREKLERNEIRILRIEN